MKLGIRKITLDSLRAVWRLVWTNNFSRVVAMLSVGLLAASLLFLGQFFRLNRTRVDLTGQIGTVRVTEIARLNNLAFKLSETLSLHQGRLSFSLVRADVELTKRLVGNLERNYQSAALTSETEQGLAAITARWEQLTPLLTEWERHPGDLTMPAWVRPLLADFQITLNLFIVQVAEGELEVLAAVRRADESIGRAFAGLIISGTGFFVAASLLVAWLSRGQLRSLAEIVSLSQFPRQSPWPVMRFDKDLRPIYMNRASQSLAAPLGLRQAGVQDPAMRIWLHRAFLGSKQAQLEVQAEDQSYALISAQIPDAAEITVYGFDITERKRAEVQVRKQLDRLKGLRRIDLGILTNPELEPTLNTVLENVIHLLGVDAAHILLRPKGKRFLVSNAHKGLGDGQFERAKFAFGQGMAGAAALSAKPLIHTNIEEATWSKISKPEQFEDFHSYFAIPLRSKKSLVGVLEVLTRERFKPDREWLDYFETLAGQAAIAIESAALREDLSQSNRKLRQAYDETLRGWARALQLRDEETEIHSQNVTRLTAVLAKRMKLPRAKMPHIVRGAILHDIGKMGIPDAILLKPGKLTRGEREVMQMHAQFAFDWLNEISYLRPALEIPYAHHERWDGGGYPRGLAGEEIPLEARIFAIVDVWDALRSNRPYRKAWPRKKAIDYIHAQSGSHFAPEVVRAFFGMVEEEGL